MHLWLSALVKHSDVLAATDGELWQRAYRIFWYRPRSYEFVKPMAPGAYLVIGSITTTMDAGVFLPLFVSDTIVLYDALATPYWRRLFGKPPSSGLYPTE